MIIIGVLSIGLIGSNVYAYNEIKNERKELSLKEENLKDARNELNVAISQIMHKSNQYASHEDMIYGFNLYAKENKINYQGNDYYPDIKHIRAHNYDEQEQIKYVALTNMSFLKDKVTKNISYIQDELPTIVMEKSIKIAEEVDINNGELTVPKENALLLEKNLKEKLKVHSWEQELLFNIDGQYNFEISSDMEKNILQEFIEGIVLKDKKLKIEEIKISISNAFDEALIKTSTGEITYIYDKNTKELKEK